MINSNYKKCFSCKQILQKTHYQKNAARNDGVNTYCIKCEKNKRKEKQQSRIKNRIIKEYREKEIWKDVPFCTLYECSTEGRVRNKFTKKILSVAINAHGYCVVSLKKTFKVHRIIAITFLPNFENKPTVEHKDDDKTNNKLYNLKWATYKEQQKFVILKKTKKIFPSKIGISELKNLEGEIWKIIQDFPDYEISNFGRIKYPIKKGKPPFKKRIKLGNNGIYKYSEFSNDKNEKKKIAIHRLIATAFIENPNKYEIVNHKDGNKHNNNIENLEWCSQKQNIQHAHDNNLIQTKRIIYQLDMNNEIIKKWDSIKDAYTSLNICRTGIDSVLAGKSKTSGGWSWCYAEKYNLNIKKIIKNDSVMKKVKQIDVYTKEIIKIWNSIAEAQKTLKIYNISRVLDKEPLKAGGFFWQLG